MVVIAWIFAPTASEMTRTWNAPEGYVLASWGELRYRQDTDTRLDDTRLFEPGWKRATWLDGMIPICPVGKKEQH